MDKLIKNNGVNGSQVTHFPSYLDTFFDDFWKNNKVIPPVNIKESNNDFNIEMAVPGRKKEDINIGIENNCLVISSEKEFRNEETKEHYHKQEFSHSSFKRTFNLPENQVDIDKISATYNDGILKVHLPKLEEAKPRPPKTIKVA